MFYKTIYYLVLKILSDRFDKNVQKYINHTVWTIHYPMWYNLIMDHCHEIHSSSTEIKTKHFSHSISWWSIIVISAPDQVQMGVWRYTKGSYIIWAI